MRIVASAVVVAVAVSLSGCAGIVRKPQVNQVRKAAIVSLYANQKVPKRGGGGVVERWDATMRLQVAEDALATFATELQRTGWALVPPNAVIESQLYQDAFKPADVDPSSKLGKVVSFLGSLERAQYFMPAGMYPVLLDDREANTRYYGDARRNDPKQVLAKLAQRLDVDAVVIVQLDYCYQGGTWSMLGNGEAVMTAASSIKAVNREGELVINMPSVPVCGGARTSSDTSAVMIGGNLVLPNIGKERFAAMFKEATRGSAVVTVTTIENAMR